MITKVQRYIEERRLLAAGQPVIVGFSGGGDSVALLHILNRLGYVCVAAHCNFHLRGEESMRDEQFCKEFAEKKRIAFEKTDFDTLAYSAQKHISVEMAARELRYNWFDAIRRQHNAQAVAVAHHRDDNAETMLINLIRGTGIRGLGGMRSRNGFVIRPLLAVGKDEIINFLQEQNLPFVTDSTNLSDAYTRNFVRLRLLPLMEAVNPSVRQMLARASEHLTDVDCIYSHAIEQAAATLLRKMPDGEIHLPITDLLKHPAPKTLLYELLKPYGFTRETSDEIARALTCASGKIFEAHKSDYKLLKDRDTLIVYKPSESVAEIFNIEADGTGLDRLPISLSLHQTPVNPSFQIDKSPSTATFDYDKLHFPLALRRWRQGDRFVPFGAKGSQKLSDYFSDHKYSLRDKERAWLLCSGDNVIWIVGKRADNRYRVDGRTKKAFVVIFNGAVLKDIIE